MKSSFISPEFLSLTYGSIIKQILKDNDYNCNEVNKEIFNIGFNLGSKWVDEFLSIKDIESCQNLNDLANKLGIEAFKYFLNIESKIKLISNKEFSILFNDNPFEEYLELPKELNLLCYSNIICGAIKGALENINVKAKINFVKDKNTKCVNNYNKDFQYEIKIILESNKNY